VAGVSEFKFHVCPVSVIVADRTHTVHNDAAAALSS
jgi:hypothetical protein